MSLPPRLDYGVSSSDNGINPMKRGSEGGEARGGGLDQRYQAQ